MNRRQFAKGLMASTALTVLGASLCFDGSTTPLLARPGDPAELPVPPLEQGRLENGRRIFDLSLQSGYSNFLPGLKTPTLGVNGPYLGPTLNLANGEKIELRVTNRIGERTTLHWHGLHLPARADGGPHQVIEPGETWTPSFTVKQKAAMYWYHPHLLHKTGLHAYFGMAGAIIVNDRQSDSAALPDRYGINDIPVVLQDKRFNRNGSLQYAVSMRDRMMGMMGDVMLVNGAIAPVLRATHGKIRLRFLNACNARTCKLGFADNRSFHVIAGDGSLLPVPIKTKSVSISPGERTQIIVDVRDGKVAELVTLPLNLAGRGSMTGRRGMMGGGMMRRMMGMTGDDGRYFRVLEIRPSGPLQPSNPLPDRLTTLPAPDLDKVSKVRRFVLNMGMGPMMMMGGGGFTINGRSMDMGRIDERVKLGATEVWEISNTSPMPHPFHIHDIQFRILDRNGQPPHGPETGLKDTVLVGSGETVRVIATFDDYADPQRPYMYHCHILEHEDAGMMGQFTVEV